MAKNKETTASLFSQMPQLSKKELSPAVKPAEAIETPKVEEIKKEVSQPTPEVQKKAETTRKPTQKKETVKAVEESAVVLRKDGKKDNRFNANKQARRYQMTLQPELFDRINELAFHKSSPQNRVSVNAVVIEALEDILKKYKM